MLLLLLLCNIMVSSKLQNSEKPHVVFLLGFKFWPESLVNLQHKLEGRALKLCILQKTIRQVTPSLLLTYCTLELIKMDKLYMCLLTEWEQQCLSSGKVLTGERQWQAECDNGYGYSMYLMQGCNSFYVGLVWSIDWLLICLGSKADEQQNTVIVIVDEAP